ncbi:transcription initiation factor IIE, beta subunit [Nadsonia fulvescens var. elongata DSM 6958]|uniref:Transcription initiation factor IIE subunit beta n=1 Tax=Nadsonia fulvescens var. elongata DSM 6958 TaxID=857566 RepID=A0A1E3PMZ2_9ASCO|nr:transcription initiation factor IIE, beta subunit [Nadsonia fulvescens var. elongata DSM 6958]
MSSLSDQLNSFKHKVKNAPTIQRRMVQNATPDIARSAPSSSEDGSKKRKVVYQAKTTGSGNHASTQLHHAVEYIKRQGRPVSTLDIQGYLSIQYTGVLFQLLKSVERIQYHKDDNTFEYIPIYNIKTADQLLTFLRSQTTYKGISAKDLKDGWPTCNEAVDRLEAKQDIIVTRTKKENLPRLLWANTGGKIGTIDDEFKAYWNKIKIPDRAELPSRLQQAGLKPTSVDPATIKKLGKGGDERKQKKPRRGKVTNTHLSGILKSY